MLAMEDIRKIVGTNLRLARQEAELSQEALADLAEIDRTYVSGVERGVRNPTIVVLARLASVLNVSPASLLDMDSQPMKNARIKKL